MPNCAQRKLLMDIECARCPAYNVGIGDDNFDILPFAIPHLFREAALNTVSLPSR